MCSACTNGSRWLLEATCEAVTGIFKPNLPLINKVMDHIEAHPEEHNQADWAIKVDHPCGTAYCYAGHAVHMSGGEMIFTDGHAVHIAEFCIMPGSENPHGRRVDDTAVDLLGISPQMAEYMFDAVRTVAELRHAVDGLNDGQYA